MSNYEYEINIDHKFVSHWLHLQSVLVIRVRYYFFVADPK